jgi:hypothetical protein
MSLAYPPHRGWKIPSLTVPDLTYARAEDRCRGHGAEAEVEITMRELVLDSELWCSILEDETTGKRYFEVVSGGIAAYPIRVLLTPEEAAVLGNDKEATRR